jgi:hypothetical protein
VDANTLTLDAFWRWASAHYNCIIRAGSDSSVLYDQPYLHWHLLQEREGMLVAQLVRGKDLVAELVVDPRNVMYVESRPDEEDQVLFELIVEMQGEAVPFYHFLMAHGYDDDQDLPSRGWTH